MTRIFYPVVCFFAALNFCLGAPSFAKGADAEQSAQLKWEVQRLVAGGRIDAVAYLGDGVLLAGTRSPHPGHIFKSADRGATWTDVGNITGKDAIGSSITCLASAGEGVAYLLTGDAHVWKSTDWGDTWSKLGRVSTNPRLKTFQHAYGLTVLDSQTVLVSDTNPEGGHVYRSTDGGKTWTDLGRVSPSALYRFEKIADGVLLNGWAGHVYKSTDDGKTWKDMGQLTDSPLYATEYLERGIVLQAAGNGTVFRSTDNGVTWTEVANLEDAADDFVYLGNGVVLYSTYTGRKQVFLSRDFGQTWQSQGPLSTGADGDVLDHVISCPGNKDGSYAVGGTIQGYIVIGTLRAP